MLEIGFAVGALIIGLAMIYGTVQSARRNKKNDPITDEATRQLYDDPDGYADHKRDELKAQLK